MGLEQSATGLTEAAALLELLRERFPEGILETDLPQGDARAIVAPEFLHRIADFLKNDPALQFSVLADITAVDYPGRELRFDVVYNCLSITTRRRVRLIARVGGAEPALDSLTDLYGSANWQEREVWDMFGIRFSGHPDLKRILMYEGFEGHPLRKDYPIRKRQPQIGPLN